MSTQDSAVAGYAYWISPDESSKIIYSLGTFHEIDGWVNDGYRRIPHGGVETGGLLFGTREGNEVRVEAYRPIQCQHAFGPSFLLSESDLAVLREQLASAASDPDLDGFRPIGWFIGHTRSALQLSDREAALFDEFFPEPGSIAVLVKPERFQPTRFGFLVRSRDGNTPRDATRNAIILPLSGQSANATEPFVASLPAPPMADKAELTATPKNPAPNPAEGTTRVRTPVYKEAHPEKPLAPSAISNTGPERAGQQENGLVYPYASLASKRSRTEMLQPSTLGLRSAAILLLAAVLGCAAGYWAYLRLPSPVIPVSIREQGGQLVVEWPSAQTEGAEYAALQVNDGQWVVLSREEKTAGHTVVFAPAGDVKIDLLAKHWLRDSRGIVRYIRTAKPRPPITPVR